MNKIDLHTTRFESSLQKFILSCDKIKRKQNISLSSLQRVLQINAKTTSLNDILLTFSIKGSKENISIRYIKEPAFSSHYFEIKVSSKPKQLLYISALNTKELMYKINHVYKLTQKL